jgi:hypothetical protein
MNEYILSTFYFDKSKTLSVAKPFDPTSHYNLRWKLILLHRSLKKPHGVTSLAAYVFPCKKLPCNFIIARIPLKFHEIEADWIRGTRNS